MIIWSGVGILVVPFFFFVGIGGEVVLGDLVGPKVGPPVGLNIGAILTFLAGLGLNREGNEHTLYGIPVQHWSWIQMLLVVYMVVFVGD